MISRLKFLLLAFIVITSSSGQARQPQADPIPPYEGRVLSRAALAQLEKVLPAWRANSVNPLPLLTVLEHLAVGYYHYHEPARALQFATEAVDVARRANRPAEHAIALVHLGVIQREEGAFDEALRSLIEAETRLAKLPQQGTRVLAHRATALNQLGMLDQEIGRDQAAVAKFQQAIAVVRSRLGVSQKSGEEWLKQIEGAVHINLADVLVGLGERTQAATHWGLASELSAGVGDRIARGREQLRTAVNLSLKGDHEGAMKLLTATAAMADLVQQPGMAGDAFAIMGMLMVRKDPTEAERLYRRAVAIFDANLRGQSGWFLTRIELATLLDSRRNAREAGEIFDETLTVVRERLNFHVGFLSESEQLTFRESVSNVLDRYFSFCLRNYREDPGLLERMTNVVLWQKGFVVTNAASQRAQIVNAGQQALADQLVAAKRDLSAAARQTEGVNKDRTAAAEERVLTLERELSTKLAAFRGDSLDVTWQSVQRALKPGQAAVEIVRFRERDAAGKTSAKYVMLVTTRAASAPRLVDLGGEEVIGAALKDYLNLTAASSSDDSRKSSGPLATATLWTPMAAALRGARTVIIAPDGELHKFNWLLLPLTSQRRVLDTHDVRILTSTRDIPRKSPSAVSNHALIVANPAFGPAQRCPEGQGAAAPLQSEDGADTSAKGKLNFRGNWCPLKGTEEEARELDILLRRAGWQVELLLDTEASEARVKRASSPRVLHLATHGRFLPDSASVRDPMVRSFVALAGANVLPREGPGVKDAEDGTLTAHEAAGLNLQGTELVVLSACETGLGTTENGEGVLGLRRALQLAGAGAVMMSLWNVPDKQTAALMRQFYSHWLGGMDKQRALRQAQRDIRNETKRDPELKADLPHYWGAFILVGD